MPRVAAAASATDAPAAIASIDAPVAAVAIVAASDTDAPAAAGAVAATEAPVAVKLLLLSIRQLPLLPPKSPAISPLLLLFLHLLYFLHLRPLLLSTR